MIYLILAPMLIVLGWVILVSVAAMGSPDPDLLIASVALIIGLGVLGSAALVALTLRIFG